MHPRSEIRETYTLQKAAEKQCQATRSTHCWGNSFHIHKTFALSNPAMSILNLGLSVTVWWVADKMSTIFSREFISINTVQQQVLHTLIQLLKKKKRVNILTAPNGGWERQMYYLYKCMHQSCLKMFQRTLLSVVSSEKSVIINFFLR